MLKIDVTEEDIRLGTKGGICNCPIALAVLRTIGKDNSVRVWQGININEEHYKLNYEMLSFIEDFDNHKIVRPFSFYLDNGRCLSIRQVEGDKI